MKMLVNPMKFCQFQQYWMKTKLNLAMKETDLWECGGGGRGEKWFNVECLGNVSNREETGILGDVPMEYSSLILLMPHCYCCNFSYIQVSMNIVRLYILLLLQYIYPTKYNRNESLNNWFYQISRVWCKQLKCCIN